VIPDWGGFLHTDFMKKEKRPFRSSEFCLYEKRPSMTPSSSDSAKDDPKVFTFPFIKMDSFSPKKSRENSEVRTIG
jgi:hypothetical protein